MREATAKKNFQEDLVGKKPKYYNILTIIANSLLYPPPRINREFIMMIIIMYQVLYQ